MKALALLAASTIFHGAQAATQSKIWIVCNSNKSDHQSTYVAGGKRFWEYKDATHELVELLDGSDGSTLTQLTVNPGHIIYVMNYDHGSYLLSIDRISGSFSEITTDADGADHLSRGTCRPTAPLLVGDLKPKF